MPQNCRAHACNDSIDLNLILHPFVVATKGTQRIPIVIGAISAKEQDQNFTHSCLVFETLPCRASRHCGLPNPFLFQPDEHIGKLFRYVSTQRRQLELGRNGIDMLAAHRHSFAADVMLSQHAVGLMPGDRPDLRFRQTHAIGGVRKRVPEGMKDQSGIGEACITGVTAIEPLRLRTG
jgi:hypothetical protein